MDRHGSMMTTDQLFTFDKTCTEIGILVKNAVIMVYMSEHRGI